MNAKELAALLNGRQYAKEITKAEAEEAKAAGLVVIFGASDDLMEFRGAIYDEIGAYNGATALLTHTGLLANECGDGCPYAEREAAKGLAVKALWSPGDGYSWKFKTDIPHETFEVVDDGEPYCRGIVFALADCKPSPCPVDKALQLARLLIQEERDSLILCHTRPDGTMDDDGKAGLVRYEEVLAAIREAEATQQ